MKSLFALFLTFSAPAAFADNSSIDPLSLCTQRRCSPTMHEILDGFKAATHSQRTDLSAYSGSCYHIHPNVNPSHEHHGVMLLRVSENETRFSGLFSFFASQNPYQDLSAKEVKDLFDKREAKKHLVLHSADFQSVVIPSESSSIFYWFKTTEEKAWLVSLWQYETPVDVRIFCEFSKAQGAD